MQWSIYDASSSESRRICLWGDTVEPSPLSQVLWWQPHFGLVNYFSPSLAAATRAKNAHYRYSAGYFCMHVVLWGPSLAHC